MNQQPGADSNDNWLPLESNPDALNPYCDKMGFDISKFKFQDLFSLDDWAQDMIQKPVLSVMFLYPLKESTRVHDEEEAKRIETEGQEVSNNLYYMKQIAKNACGTVAAMHAILNTDQSLIKADSVFGKFLADTKTMNPLERGNYFLGATDLKQAHTEAVNSGANQSSVQAEVDTHFIAFVEKDGHLYELDGRKKFPVNHGPTTRDNLLPDACKAIRKFMERDPNENNFSTIVLAAPPLE